MIIHVTGIILCIARLSHMLQVVHMHSITGREDWKQRTVPKAGFNSSMQKKQLLFLSCVVVGSFVFWPLSIGEYLRIP